MSLTKDELGQVCHGTDPSAAVRVFTVVGFADQEREREKERVQRKRKFREGVGKREGKSEREREIKKK